jgi:hypothetical protein
MSLRVNSSKKKSFKPNPLTKGCALAKPAGFVKLAWEYDDGCINAHHLLSDISSINAQPADRPQVASWVVDLQEAFAQWLRSISFNGHSAAFDIIYLMYSLSNPRKQLQIHMYTPFAYGFHELYTLTCAIV